MGRMPELLIYRFRRGMSGIATACCRRFIPVAQAEIAPSGDMKALCVERFDRRWLADVPAALLSEDFATVSVC